MAINSDQELRRFLKDSELSPYPLLDRILAMVDLIDGYSCNQIRERYPRLLKIADSSFAYWWRTKVGATRGSGRSKKTYYENEECLQRALIVRGFLAKAYQQLTKKELHEYVNVYVPPPPKHHPTSPDYVANDINIDQICRPKSSPAGGRRIIEKNGILSTDSIVRVESLLQEHGRSDEATIYIAKTTGLRRFVITAIAEGQYDPHELEWINGVKPTPCVLIRNFEELCQKRPTTIGGRALARRSKSLTPAGVRNKAEEKRIADTFLQHHSDPYLQEQRQREEARRGLFTI
jgi:hypothetical protein